MEALKGVSLAETPRGPIKFDQLNNVIGTIYIRRLGKDGAKYGLKLWNKTIKTYENVSPSLDLARTGILGASGLLTRLSATEEVLRNLECLRSGLSGGRLNASACRSLTRFGSQPPDFGVMHNSSHSVGSAPTKRRSKLSANERGQQQGPLRISIFWRYRVGRKRRP